MHLQIRSTPALSPADLARFLTVLADAGINLASAGGSNIESGGEFAFAVAHDEGDDEDIAFENAMAVLRDAGYNPRLVKVDHSELANEPGQLLEFVKSVSETNTRLGRSIRDIAVGVPDPDGRIVVQIYSE
jgi:hypothetical protein